MQGSSKARSNGLISSASPSRTSRGSNEEVANSLLNPFLGGGSSTNSMSVSTNNGYQGDLLLTGLLQTTDEGVLRKFYRDMYWHDSVCGSTADMMSTFPFGEFTLGGMKDNELDTFESSISRLNLRNGIPEIALDYLVNGAHASNLVYDDKSKTFSDLIAFDLDYVTLKESPLYSMDPELRVVNGSQAMRNLRNEDSEYFRLQRRSIPPKLLQALKADAFISDPLTTLYIARNVFPYRKIGISIFKRVLPIYLLEKTLWRGTLVEAAKRLRSLRHMTAGDDVWEPSPEDLNSLVSALQEAEMDPLGGILATRNSVSISEVSNGGDFWKITDVVDTTTPMKLRALGISEGFLSGDSVYSNAEASVNSFMESADWFRSMVTHKLFYNKLFPITSHVNGYIKDDSGHTGENRLEAMNDATNYRIPTVNWFKQLHTQSDQSLIDTLEKLEDKGVPVTLRAYAAAGGASLDALLRDQKEDQELRAKLSKLGVGGQDGQDVGGEDSEDGFELQSLSNLINPDRLKHRPLLSRDFGEAGTIYDRTKTGKLKSVPNQKAAQQKANDAIITAVRVLRDPNARARVAKTMGVKNIYTGGKIEKGNNK